MHLNPDGRAHRTVAVGRGQFLQIFSDGEIRLHYGATQSGEWITFSDVEQRWPYAITEVDRKIMELTALARGEQQ
jgi:hypothetical protein